MTKLRVVSSSGWKPVTLEGAILTGDVSGLVGIEELVDYKLERDNEKLGDSKVEKKEKKKKKKKVALKRHCASELANGNTIDCGPLSKKFKSNDEKSKYLERENEKCNDDLVVDESSELSDNNTDHDIDVEAWANLGVPQIIIKALAEQNFQSPTTVQALTLAPAILGHRDILGAAETGSGKTLAFGIPIISGILELKNRYLKSTLTNRSTNTEDVGSDTEELNDSDAESECSEVESDIKDIEEDANFNNDGIGCMRVINNVKITDSQNISGKPLYALILTPTRELAIQIRNHLVKAAKYTNIKIAVVLGGMAAVKQERILSKGPEIVIATPGRLWELMQQNNPHLSQMDSIKYLAVDETDRMLEKGHFQELHDILERINVNETKVKRRQTFVFSATLTMVHDIPFYLQKKKQKYARSKIFKLAPGQKLQKIIEILRIKNPKIIDITKGTGTADNLTECRISCTIDHKDYYLYYFLKRHTGRTLIFCNSIGCVKRLTTLFSILQCNPLPLHASMQQKQRLKNLERFQADKNGLLIATDVAARGLDIPAIEHVIHYQVPRTSESYVHRSGRTARAQKEGITVLIMDPSEKQNYDKLCKTLNRTHDLPTFPVVDRLLIAVKERVNIAREIDKLELKCKRNNVQKSWLQKAVDDMDLILDEDQIETTLEPKEVADLRSSLKVKKHRLTSLLSKPLFPTGFSGKYLDMNVEYSFDQTNEKAVDLMKKAINDVSKEKKKIITDNAGKQTHRKKQKSKK